MINHNTLRPKAVIIWLGAATGDGPPWSAAAAAGYHICRPADGVRADIAVVDIRSGVDAPESLVAKARKCAPPAGILIVAPCAASDAARARLRRQGEVVFVSLDASPAIAAIRERLRLASLAGELGDRILSLTAADRPLKFKGYAESPGPLSVLIAGPPSPLSLAAVNALRIDAATTCVLSAGQAMRALDHRAFDGIVLLPEDENDLLLALARALRRHREHRHLPIVIASKDESLLHRCAHRDGFATLYAAHVAADLAPRIKASVRRTGVAASMRGFLRSPEGCAGSLGAVSPRFFAQHANRLIRIADETARPVSFIGFSLLPSGSHSVEGAGPPPEEALRTVLRVVRAEDVIARMSSKTLVLLFRNTMEHEAARIAGRLAGVAAGTMSRAAPHCATAVAIERRNGDPLRTSVAALIEAMKADASTRRRASGQRVP